MKRPRILVVDDDQDIRNLVVELLGRAGHDVEQAADGRAGLKALHANPPDLVVLDVSMPELDGWQTLERIRDLTDVPVLMLTARGSELERVRGLQAGADDYVVKPFGRQELIARVQAFADLDRRHDRSGVDRDRPVAGDEQFRVAEHADDGCPRDQGRRRPRDHPEGTHVLRPRPAWPTR